MQALAEVSTCPESPEETAERCAMQWLEAGEAEAFQRHTSECSHCAEVLAEYAAFARLLRSALDEACRVSS
ncbi:MAG: hypothetical protein HY822_18545 [Acidobacteria bacterium]|nr:hypothetical protein [Acidobacteriota bacterium]